MVLRGVREAPIAIEQYTELREYRQADLAEIARVSQH